MFRSSMRVEFLGIPRQRAGVADVDLEVCTLGEALDALVDRFPRLHELILEGRLHPSVAANLNGAEFISDREQPLCPADHLLILSADVGG